ncbi:hypothetical protein EZS27_008825 [termite gut metagenome]|uniref:DUF4836 family protein n=1 Tax=termite gut metagenome TaxID=433724 RepID=A0A5J4SDT3_9ZZZZ
MKKNMIYCFSLLLALVIAIASCRTLKTIYQTPKTTYTDALPTDVSMILSFDVKSILKKAELSEGKNTDLKQKAIDFLKARMSPASFAGIEKVIQKPKESGIDIAAPFYIAFTEITKDPVILAKVSNLNKLKDFWNVMTSERITTPIEKRGNYSYGTFAGNSAICAFNESVLLFGANNFEEIDKLMSQKKTESGALNPTFVKLKERKGEIKYYLNLKTLAKVNFMGTPLNEGVKEKFDMELFFFMSFEKGKVCMQADMVTKNENLTQLFEKSTKAIGKQKSVFTHKIPSSVFAYIGFNINGEEYYNYLKGIATTYSTTFAGLAPYLVESAKELFSWIKGDVAVALLDVSSKVPVVCAYAEVADASLLKKTVDNLQKNNLIGDSEEIVELKENDYVYQKGGIRLHIGVIDKYLYVTNSEDTYQTIIQGIPPSGKTLKGTKFASKIKTTPQYMFISVDNILQSPLGLGGGAKTSKLLSRISYLEIVGNEKHTYGGELNLIMKDEKTNALAQIMALIRELSGI